MNNSKKMHQKRAIVVLLAVLCVSILFSVVSFVRPREVFADEITLVDSSNVTYSSTDDSFVIAEAGKDTVRYISEYGWGSYNTWFSFGMNTERTDGNTTDTGTWRAGGIVISTRTPNSNTADGYYYINYDIFAIVDTGSTTGSICVMIIADNGAVAEVRQGGTIAGGYTGAPIRYDLAFINNVINLKINDTIYTITQNDLSCTTGDAGYYNPLFNNNAQYEKRVAIKANWIEHKFSNISSSVISELPGTFSPTSGMFTNTSGVSNSTDTSATIAGGSVKYFRDTADSTELNTTGNFSVKFSMNRTDGVTDKVGTWETAGLYVETASNNYRLFMMREANNVTVLYVVKNNGAENLEYRIAKNYSGTGASISLEFVYIASEETYYIVWGSDFYALNYATKGIRKNEDLYSNTSDKKIGIFANVTTEFTNVEKSIDTTTVANKKPTGTASLFIANPIFFNNMFTPGAVLQRNKKVKIFGRGGDIDNTVKVTFNGQTKESTITADGWSVYLDPMTANKNGQTIYVEQYNGSTVVSSTSIENVVVGEVFLGNGQSNMQTAYDYYTDSSVSLGICGFDKKTYYDNKMGVTDAFATEYATYNNYNNIRIMTEPYYKPSTPTVNNSVTASWTIAGDSTGAITYKTTSAFALGYASHLSHMLGDEVPIGVYVSAIGGSYIENWLPPESISKLQASGNINPYAEASDGGLGLFYNGMIHTSVGYTFGGIIFYQGCANSSEEVKYKEAFKEYASVYRTLYEDANLPIISMQLPQYNEGDPWMEFRDMQQNLVNDIDNLYIVCGIDRGDNTNQEGNVNDSIHPCDKWGYSERAAGVYAKLLGLTPTAGTPYGISPRIIAASKAGNDIMITLDANATTLTANNVNSINGFEYSTDGTTWTATTAKIVNNVIYITGAGSATHIRYLYAEVFADNSYFIYNEYNLPVFPIISLEVSEALNGFVNGYLYDNGTLYNGTYTDGKLYKEGLPFTGKHTDGKYYESGLLKASGFVTIDSILYSVSNGNLTAYTGVYSVDNKYYSNGTLLASGTVTVNGIVYSVVNGNMTKYSGVYNDKHYTEGVATVSGFVTYNEKLYSISNGTMTTYTGVYSEDNKYYSNGSLLASGIVEYNSKVYSVTNGNMTLYTGDYNNMYYENGTLYTGVKEFSGKLYQVTAGVKTLFNGTHTDGKLYQEGLVFTGKHTDGKYYSNGSLLASGTVTDEGKLYNVSNGVMTLVNGVHTDDKYYENGTLYSGTKVVSEILYTITNGVMTKYTGIYDVDNKLYVEGVIYTGVYSADSKLYVNGELFTGKYTDDKYYIDGVETQLVLDGSNNPLNGFHTDGKLYQEGLVFTGKYTEDGKYYSNGSLLVSGTVTLEGKLYNVSNGVMTVVNGVHTDGKYYENGELLASGTVTVEGKLYNVSNGVMTVVNGVHTDGKYYENGELLASGTVTVEGKLYNVSNGVMTVVNGVHTDGKYYENGELLASGTVTVEGKLYNVSNGVMTVVNGVHTDGKYYSNGTLLVSGTVTVSGIVYSVVNGNMTLFTGRHENGTYYQDGVILASGVVTVEGKLYTVTDGNMTLFNGTHTDSKLYVDGELFTGTYTDGKIYENGVEVVPTEDVPTVNPADDKLYTNDSFTDLYSGTYEGKLYNEGVLFTGMHTDGKYYSEGTLYSGTKVISGILYTITEGIRTKYTGVYAEDNKLYVDGEIYTGIYDGDDKLYVEGSLYTGEYEGKHYQDGVEVEPETEYPTVNPEDNKLYTDSTFTTLYSGIFESKLYAEGVLFTGKHTDGKYYENGELKVSGYVVVADILYTVSNGTMTGYSGVYAEDNKYYVDGELLATGHVIVAGKAYSVEDGVMSVYTGILNDKYYEEGVGFTGIKILNGVAFDIVDGVKTEYTGFIEGKLYVDGAIYSGIYIDGKLYKNGSLFTGKNDEDGKYYQNGKVVEVVLDNDGELFTGFLDSDGKYYQYGLLFTGILPVEGHADYGKYYKDGVIYQEGYVVYNGKAYSVENGDMTLFTGILDNKFYMYGDLYTGTKIINGTCYSVEDGVMTKYTGVFSDLYYKDGAIYEEGYVIWEGKAYSVEDGVMTKYSGIMNDMFFIDGEPYTGVKIINGICYSVENGVMTKYSGVFNDGLYYKDGAIYEEGYAIWQGKAYSVLNGEMTQFTGGAIVIDDVLYMADMNSAIKFTGIYNEKYYADGVMLISGIVIYNEKAYKVINGNMTLYTGEFNGANYVDGEFVEYVGDLVYDNDGNPLTGVYTDGKYYSNGMLFTGTVEVNGAWNIVVDGVMTLIDGLHTDGKIYDEGYLFTGKYEDEKYYSDGVLFTGVAKVGRKWYSINNGVMTLFTGEYEGSYYVDGDGFTGEYNGKLYSNGLPFTGKNTSEEYGEKNLYYSDGVILEEGIVIDAGNCYTVNEGRMTAYTGEFEGQEYVNGVPVRENEEIISDAEKPYTLWNCSSSFGITGLASITVLGLILAVVVIRLKKRKD